MGKGNNKARRYATVRRFDDGRAWQHEVPVYIKKLSVGDIVVVSDPAVEDFTFGEILSIDPCIYHREGNVWPIVDKVNVRRWKGFVESACVKAQLLKQMEKRQEVLDSLACYREAAEADGEMRDLLVAYQSYE